MSSTKLGLMHIPFEAFKKSNWLEFDSMKYCQNGGIRVEPKIFREFYGFDAIIKNGVIVYTSLRSFVPFSRSGSDALLEFLHDLE